MKTGRWCVAAFALILSDIAWAEYGCKVSLWRGESLSVLLPDQAHEIAGRVDGLNIERGTVLPVRYLVDNRGVEYRLVADRAVYGSTEQGLHFATVMADTDAKPGTYKFGQLSVTIVDRVLPPASEWKYHLDFWQHPWAVARVNGCEPFSTAHYRAMEPLWRQLAAAGQKVLTVTIVDKPWNHQCYDAYGSMIGRRRMPDGTWRFDYSRFDEYVSFGRACGIGPQIGCYTMCSWGYVVDYVDERGKPVTVVAKPGTQSFEMYWHDFLMDFERHLKEKEWLENTYISMDERSPEDLVYISSFLRRIAPGLKIAMSGDRNPSAYKGVEIDSYSQAMQLITPEFLSEVPMRRSQGKVTTYYICCNPSRPNTFMGSGAAEAFVCGFLPVVCGLDGLCRWAYNSWGENPIMDMSYNRWDSGDTALIYPDGSPSWRFLDLKNGIQQAEKFRILKEEGVRISELERLAKCFVLRDLLAGADYRKLRENVLKELNR